MFVCVYMYVCVYFFHGFCTFYIVFAKKEFHCTGKFVFPTVHMTINALDLESRTDNLKMLVEIKFKFVNIN